MLKLLLTAKGQVDLVDVKDSTSLMFHAVHKGDDNYVKLLQDSKVDANVKEAKKSDSLLSWAAYYKYPKIVKTLIDAKANVNDAYDVGFTPIMEASMKGDTDSIRYLLWAGADPYKTNISGQNALHKAKNRQTKLQLERSIDHLPEWFKNSIPGANEKSGVISIPGNKLVARFFNKNKTFNQTNSFVSLPSASNLVDIDKDDGPSISRGLTFGNLTGQ